MLWNSNLDCFLVENGGGAGYSFKYVKNVKDLEEKFDQFRIAMKKKYIEF